MAELVRGSIADRPWGFTFAQFGLRAVTGQLTVHAVDGKDYKVAFDEGSIVGATSPLTADSAIRVALTANLITSSQVGTITRAIAARSGDDEIEVLAATCKLDIGQSLKLRRRVTVQRAARTFAIENGTFVLDADIEIPTAYDAAVDLRAVVYQGARVNLSDTRMIGELRDLGSHFILGDAARVGELGLDATALPIVDGLRTGASVAELEARNRDLDPRTIQAVVYTLVVCRDAKAVTREVAKTDSGTQRRLGPIVEVDARPRTSSGPQTMPLVALAPPPSTKQAASQLRPPAGPAPSEPAASDSFSGPAAIGLPGLEEEPTRSRNLVGSVDLGPPELPTGDAPPAVSRVSSAFDFLDPSSATIGNAPGPAHYEEPTVRGVDLARVAGKPPDLPRKTPPSGVPVIPVGSVVARPQLPTNPAGGSFIAARPQSSTNPPSGSFIAARPQSSTKPGALLAARVPLPTDRSRSASNPPSGSFVPPSGSRARSPSNAPGGTFSTAPDDSPSSDRPRSPTTPRVRSPSTPPSDGTPSEVSLEPSERGRALGEAREAYDRGRQALRDGDLATALDELTRASTLNPHEFDHSAMLAWARCVAAPPAERSKAAEKARKMLTHATQKSADPEQARFHLGQLERLLGHDRDALVLFQAVLRSVPDHAGAKAEIAALEAKADKGLLGLFKKKT